MPEGPEVRRNAELLSHLLVNHKLTEIALVSGKLLKSSFQGSDAFEPAVVSKVKAYGKLITIQLEGGAFITSTLGMSGWWYPPKGQVSADEKAYKDGELMLASAIVDQALKHTRVVLKNNVDLAAFTDPRNFGNFRYYKPGEFTLTELKSKIGLDLLNELPGMLLDVDGAKHYLVNLKKTASTRVKGLKLGDLALEQSFIAGLGNIYRAEALWLAGIDPYCKFKDLSDDDWLKFCEVSMGVLQIAYLTAGSMYYPASFIEECTQQRVSADHRGHLAYGRVIDIFGNPIVRDDAFGRALWRKAAI